MCPIASSDSHSMAWKLRAVASWPTLYWSVLTVYGAVSASVTWLSTAMHKQRFWLCPLCSRLRLSHVCLGLSWRGLLSNFCTVEARSQQKSSRLVVVERPLFQSLVCCFNGCCFKVPPTWLAGDLCHLLVRLQRGECVLQPGSVCREERHVQSGVWGTQELPSHCNRQVTLTWPLWPIVDPFKCKGCVTSCSCKNRQGSCVTQSGQTHIQHVLQGWHKHVETPLLRLESKEDIWGVTNC